MNFSNPAHAARVLDHQAQQWPLGTAPVVLQAAAQTKADCVDLLAMVKRASVHVGSVALLTTDEEVRRVAMAFVKESSALIRRIEGRR